jgi:hypothetical protein
MPGLFDAKRDGFDACALRKRRIQKWLWVQARHRARFGRALPKLFQQSAALVAGTAGPKVDCSCAASLYWRQGNWSGRHGLLPEHFNENIF